MRTMLTITALLLMMPSQDVWSQGNPWASPEPSIKISRSSEHKAEGEEFEKKVPVKLEFGDRNCAAQLQVEYYQKATVAHVKSTLSNEQCGASAGTYVIRIRYRPDEGEQGEVRYEESWSRTDSADIVLEKDYYVGDDLEVRRVSPADLKCTCAEIPAADPAPQPDVESPQQPE